MNLLLPVQHCSYNALRRWSTSTSKIVKRRGDSQSICFSINRLCLVCYLSGKFSAYRLVVIGRGRSIFDGLCSTLLLLDCRGRKTSPQSRVVLLNTISISRQHLVVDFNDFRSDYHPVELRHKTVLREDLSAYSVTLITHLVLCFHLSIGRCSWRLWLVDQHSQIVLPI